MGSEGYKGSTEAVQKQQTSSGAGVKRQHRGIGGAGVRKWKERVERQVER